MKGTEQQIWFPAENHSLQGEWSCSSRPPPTAPRWELLITAKGLSKVAVCPTNSTEWGAELLSAQYMESNRCEELWAPVSIRLRTLVRPPWLSLTAECHYSSSDSTAQRCIGSLEPDPPRGFLTNWVGSWEGDNTASATHGSLWRWT